MRARRWILVALALVAGFVAPWSGCHSTPLTHRKQLLLLPESEENLIGEAAYRRTLGESTESTNARYKEMVERVGRRLAAVSGRPDYQWEFHLLASEEQNAFCLPGGKVAVYEGILPICQNEAGLAVVMSHEIAHALARHGGERMSQDYVVNSLGNVLDSISQGKDEASRKRIDNAYGLASKYGYSLPFSRKHETEADEIGLTLLAQAGYNPEEAPRFWERFAASQRGETIPEFLSTHPSDAHRAADLRQRLPAAVQRYATAKEKFGLGETIIAAAEESGAGPETTIGSLPGISTAKPE